MQGLVKLRAVTRRMSRTLLLGMLGSLGVMTAFAGLAWACTPQARIRLSTGSVSTEGSTITVTGTQFVPGPVEIRLDSGPILAVATGPDFTTTITLPKAKRGVYFVRAIADQSEGQDFGDEKPVKAKVPAAPLREAPDPVLSPAPSAKEPASRSERPRSDPERSSPSKSKARPPAAAPATTVATAGAAGAVAPVEVSSEPKSATPATPRTRAAEVPDRPAIRSAAGPRAVAPLVTSLRNPWSERPATGPGLDAARASAEPSTGPLLLGVGLVVLGLAGLGGASVALVRSRCGHPPAPEPALPALAPVELPAFQPAGGLSLEAELEQLLAEHAPLAGPPGSGEDPSRARETAGSAV